MGSANGGYFIGDRAPVVFILAALMLLAAVTGVLGRAQSWWSVAATSLLTGYTAWTFASLLWSPNRGDAWFGATTTLFYLMAFWVVLAFVTLGASRRWALAASSIGPALVAAFTLPNLAPNIEDLFRNNRLVGSVGYYNGEAAFLLLPFWVSVYLAGSRRVNPMVRGVVLAGAVLGAEVAVLTQSRGAMVAMAASLPVFFLFSGKRLRGLLALAPIAAALFVTFPGLNQVYLEFLNEGSPAAAVGEVVPTVWLTAAGAGIYGLLWGLADRLWRPPVAIARTAGAVALAGTIVVVILGGVAFTERVGEPVTWGQQKWEAFKTNDTTGQEQSRYLSASGTGRYTLWEVAWEDFVSDPVLGVGTYNYEATYYQNRDEIAGYSRWPHILPLEVLAERGVIGGVLFFGFLGVCLAAGLWRRFTSLNAEGKAQVGAMVAALAYWFVHSGAEWFWQLPAITMLAMVYLALLVAPWNRPETTPTGWSVRAAGAGIAVLAILTIAPLYVADRYLAQSLADTNPRTSLEKAEQAQKFNPIHPRLAQREAELATQIGDWPRAERAYKKEIELNPEHYVSYLLMAQFYEQRGETEKALSFYRKALERNPLDPQLKEGVSRLQGQG
ncbi:MAG: O-antigen ligase family protein [Rubrobacteraceae bacterium]